MHFLSKENIPIAIVSLENEGGTFFFLGIREGRIFVLRRNKSIYRAGRKIKNTKGTRYRSGEEEENKSLISQRMWRPSTRHRGRHGRYRGSSQPPKVCFARHGPSNFRPCPTLLVEDPIVSFFPNRPRQTECWY
jgi:hypothetical protein